MLEYSQDANRRNSLRFKVTNCMEDSIENLWKQKGKKVRGNLSRKSIEAIKQKAAEKIKLFGSAGRV